MPCDTGQPSNPKVGLLRIHLSGLIKFALTTMQTAQRCKEKLEQGTVYAFDASTRCFA